MAQGLAKALFMLLARVLTKKKSFLAQLNQLDFNQLLELSYCNSMSERHAAECRSVR